MLLDVQSVPSWEDMGACLVLAHHTYACALPLQFGPLLPSRTRTCWPASDNATTLTIQVFLLSRRK